MNANTNGKPQAEPCATGARPEAPAAESKAPQADPIQAVLDRARAGDWSALPELEKILDDHPGIWRDFYRLSGTAERAWTKATFSNDLVARQSLQRQIQQFKRDLAGSSPTALENILVERIASCWLAVNHAEIAEAGNDDVGGKVLQLRVRQAEAANRRYLAAVKALAVVRRLSSGLRIEINHTERSPATSEGGAAQGPAQDRLNGLFNGALNEEKKLASTI